MTYRDEQYRACESFSEGRFDLRSDLFYGDDNKTGRVDGVEWVGVVKINCFLVWISLREDALPDRTEGSVRSDRRNGACRY